MNKKLSFKIAFSGLMAALSVAILLMSGFVPILTYCAPLIACIFLVPVMEEIDRKWAWMTWVATSLLALLISADKEAAFFYLFVGYYPMLKPALDKIWNKPLQILAKVGVFSFAIVAMYALLYFVIRLDVVMKDLQAVSIIMNIVYIAVMVLILMCFDFILRYVSRFYRVRIKPRLRLGRKVMGVLLFAGVLAVCGSDNTYAATKAVTYFGDEWPTNFLNSEHAQAEADFEQIKADGFNTVIYCVPWREIQPVVGGGFDADAIAKLDQMIGRAEASGVAVMLRLGYTWDYGGESNVMSRFEDAVRGGAARQSWLNYASRIYQLCASHGNFAGAFITWEDWWTALSNTCSGYPDMDEKLTQLLTDTQTVFPNLSMECRLHADKSGSTLFEHTSTYACGSAPFTSAMLAVSMGFPDGSTIDPGEAVQMSSLYVSKAQGSGKPVFIDQFLYMETTPGYEYLPSVTDVNAYLAGMSGVFKNQTIGYGIWTYRDYADNLLSNPEFGQGRKNWNFSSGVSVENVAGNNKAHMEPYSSIRQSLIYKGYGSGGSSKVSLQVDAEEPGSLTIALGTNSRSVNYDAGHSLVNVDFGTQTKGEFSITASAPVYVDNVKVYSWVTEGNIYKMDGTPGGYLAGVRALNAGF